MTFSRFRLMAPLSAVAIALSAPAAPAAERITFQFGHFEGNLPVASLKTYAETGNIDPDLGLFLNFLQPQVQRQFRRALTQPPNIMSDAPPALAASQWLNGPMGDRILAALGSIIKPSSGDNGKRAIRSAVLLATEQSDAPTLIEMLQAFPDESIYLDLAQVLAYWQRGQVQIQRDIALIERLKQSAIAAVSEDFGQPPLPSDLTQPGPNAVERQTWTLQARDRNRRNPVDIYQPQNLTALSGPIPVVVMSHGYAVSRDYFAGFAAHLASYGMVVALPEHTDSNQQTLEQFELGQGEASFQLSEFLNRPRDVSAVLDELERRNAAAYQNRLQLDRVGMVGHSFGGYTALMLGGATVDLDQLQRRCEDLLLEINAALLLACRALEFSPEAAQPLREGSLKDERVQWLMAISPVSSLFGEAGMAKIKIPTIIAGGSYDIAAPLVPEQVQPFDWLKTAEKYLYVMERFSHEENFTRWVWRAFGLEQSLGKPFEVSNQQLQKNLHAVALAAAEVYLRDRADYRPYLTAGYIDAISQEPLKLRLVRELPAMQADHQTMQQTSNEPLEPGSEAPTAPTD